MKSQRNKTIDFPLEANEDYLRACLPLKEKAPVSAVTDKTILGDSFEALPLLPEAFADLVIADPPYNLSKNFGGNTFSRVSEDEYADYTRSWLTLVLPLMKPNASVYVCCDWRSSAAVSRVLGEFFTIRNRITWQREKGRGAAKNWKNAMEDVWFATVSDDYYFDLEAVKLRRRVVAPYRADGAPKDWEDTPDGKFRNTCPSNFWDDVTVPYWSMPENTAHPTQKPEKLLAKLILASSPAGGMVFDPFLGSGSTSVTAKKLGRHYCGVEQNPLYCAWAEYRLRLAESSPAIQGFENGVFKERNTK